MIVKLQEKHRAQLVDFLQQDPYYALFFSGNLQAMGFDHEHLEYWGQFNEETLVAVLMRYVRNWTILASDESLDLVALIAIPNDQEVAVVTGKPWIVDRMLEGLTKHELPDIHDDFFCSLQKENFQPGPMGGVRKTDLDDLAEIHELYVGGEFAHITGETYERRLLDSKCRSFAMTDEQGRIVSVAMTIVETKEAAMIGSVFTPERYRGRGYASFAMSALCEELFAEGKEPCLFYDNPSAGVIYRRLGFQDLGMFKMAKK